MVYTVRFIASPTGALVAGANVEGSGDVTLKAPAGTVFAADLANYQFADVTKGTTGTTFAFNGVRGDGGATISLPVPISIAAGDQVTVTAPGTASTTSGNRSLTITTSSDTPGVHAGYTLVAPSPVTAQSVGLSTTAAGATAVGYRVAFTASKTGGLVPDTAFTAGAGDVILSAPAGTVFDHDLAAYDFDDITSGKTGHSFGFQGAISRGGATISMPVPIVISAGDKVSVVAHGAGSPHGAGPMRMTISTTSDTRAVSAGYKLTAALRVQGLFVTPSFTQAGAPGAVYTIGLSTSGTGAIEQGGEIVISGPPGTVFPSDSDDYCIQSGGSSFCAPVLGVSLGKSGSAAAMTVFQAIPASTPAVITITGVRNGSAHGSGALTVTTSSDTAAASAPLQFIAWSGAQLTGTVSFQGTPQPGVQMLTCPVAGTPGPCESTATSGSGTFAEPVNFGTYALTATPASLTGAQAATVQVTASSAHPIVSAAITLQKPPGVPSGSTFKANGQTFTAGQVPSLFWEGPSSLSLAGPRDGLGVVAVTGTNTNTGAQQSVVAPLIETPRGSGSYTATLPAMYPVHGAATVQSLILPPPSSPPSPTDLKGGSSSGGTRLLAVVHGSVKEILFGGKPGTGLQQVAPGLYTVISPAGAGSVPMTAVVSAASPAQIGARRGAQTSTVPMGNWLYLPTVEISSSSGPSDGDGTVTFTGAPLGLDPVVIFGGDPSREVTQTGQDSYTVSVPPGAGTEPITVVVPGTGFVDAGTYTRTDTSNDLAAQRSDYYGNGFEGLAGLSTISSIGNAILGKPGGLESLLEGVGESWITALTGYKFVNGPGSVVLSTLGSELLAAGPEGILAYMLARIAVNEYDKFVGAQFGALIDPSGTVVDRSGRPVAGAKATLQTRSSSGGGFEAVAAAGAGISPHVNPQTTGKDGRFDWNAAAGVYRVHALSATCRTTGHQPASGNTVPFTLPPPAVGLVIALPCQLGKATRPRVTGLSPAVVPSAGGPVLVTGTGLGAATRVTLGKHAVSFVRLGAGLLQITVPPGAGSSPVAVTTPSGTSTSAPGVATLRYLSLAVPPALDVAVHGVSVRAVAALSAPRLTTISAGDLMLAFVSASGPAGKAQRVTAVAGGGLAWKLVRRSDQKGGGTAEVWQARAKGAVRAAAIMAKLLDKAQGSITVAAFTGAGSVAGTAAGSGRGAPSVLAAVRPNSVIWAVGRDTSGTAAVKPARGQSLVYLDRLASAVGTAWIQVAPAVAGISKVRVSDSAPTAVPWELVAVAIGPVT